MSFIMTGWVRVSLLAATGTLRAPGQVADDLRGAGGPVIFTGHRFGTVPPYARLLCNHLAVLRRPWAIESTVTIGGDRDLLPLARRSARPSPSPRRPPRSAGMAAWRGSAPRSPACAPSAGRAC